MDDEARVQELVHRGGDKLDEALQLIGVYVTDKGVVGRDTVVGPEYALAITGALGRVAFTDRVQNPEQDEINERFRELTDDFSCGPFDNGRSGEAGDQPE